MNACNSMAAPRNPQRALRIGVLAGIGLASACYAGIDSAPHEHNLRRVKAADGTLAIALLDGDGEEVARAAARHGAGERTLMVAMGDETILSSFDHASATTAFTVLGSMGSFHWRLGETEGDHVPGNAARYEELTTHWNNQFLSPGYEGWVNHPPEQEAIEFRGCQTIYGSTQEACEQACFPKRLDSCISGCAGLPGNSLPGSGTACALSCIRFAVDSCEDACRDCPESLPGPPPPPPPACWPCGCPNGPNVPCGDDGDDDNCANGCCFNDGC
ncbi:MAG: hypothetical protein AAF721_00055 [Myxococcota bacterium]